MKRAHHLIYCQKCRKNRAMGITEEKNVLKCLWCQAKHEIGDQGKIAMKKDKIKLSKKEA